MVGKCTYFFDLAKIEKDVCCLLYIEQGESEMRGQKLY